MTIRWKPALGTALCVFKGLLHTVAAEPSSPAEFDAAFAALSSARGSTNEAARLRSLFNLQWRYAMAESPESATYNGHPEFNDRWQDLSKDAIQRRKHELVRTRNTLATFQPGRLDPESELYRELFDLYLRMDEEGARFPSEYLLLNQLQGPQQDIPQTLSLMRTDTGRGVEEVLARLASIPRYLDQATAVLRDGLAQGITPPQITLRNVPAQVLALIPDDPSKSPLMDALSRLPKAASAEQRARWESQGRSVLTNQVYPAFKAFHRFLSDEYLPKARTQLACSDLPEGKAWYAHRVRRITTTDLTPDQIHEIGLSEVRRIRAAMEALRVETGFPGDLPAFFHHLRTEPKFFHETGTALLAGYRDISKRIDAGLPRLFGKLPRLPYGVQPIPSYSERSQTTAYYQPGSLTAGRPGNFFANTYNLRMRPIWEMEALTLHEACPGHHLQIALAQETDGAPEFQKHAETTAFVEGWGLYAESLGTEFGLYKDPYSRFGQLTYEMWRAIRLVLDTGIHSKGWTRDQAIRFFMDNAGKTEHDITVEVDRYIVWPGQALAYKIGQLKIREIRALAEKRLGARFDVRNFHDELLAHGALPLNVLEPRMRAWIESQANSRH
jgi:uncharacterized protein (DUF885 family)